jgi:hypothetical protein
VGHALGGGSSAVDCVAVVFAASVEFVCVLMVVPWVYQAMHVVLQRRAQAKLRQVFLVLPVGLGKGQARTRGQAMDSGLRGFVRCAPISARAVQRIRCRAG